MSAEDQPGSLTAAQESGVRGQLYRPYLAALLEAQPLPMLFYGPAGTEFLHNAMASMLLTTAPDGTQRVLAHDGTDLWTIVAARSEEANPILDLRLRIRLADGQAPETTVAVSPLCGAGGSLAGALVIVLSMPSQRLREVIAGTVPGPSHDFNVTAGLLGELAGAARVAVFEVDPDFPTEVGVLAMWAMDGSAYDKPTVPLRGTLLDTFGGKRLVCVPSGLSVAYPDDPLVGGTGYEAFVGVALANQSGRQVGLLVGLWREPLIDIPGTTALFLIVARQAARALTDMVSRRELRESEQRYGSVFEGSAVPILLVEPNTTQVVDANPAACGMYGYPHEEFVTMSILQIDALAAESVQAELQRALEEDGDVSVLCHVVPVVERGARIPIRRPGTGEVMSGR